MAESITVNRYRIGQVENLEVRHIKNEEYLIELLKKIEKYNNNSKNPYLLGNINIDRKENIITFKKYKKITIPKTLEEIDKFTTKLRSDHDIKLLYGTKMTNNHPIVIIYRANKQIKTLPIIYKKNANYIDRKYLKSLIIKHGKCYDFISSILDSKSINSHARKSLDDLDNLYALRESIKNNYPLEVSITPLIRFYHSFITDSKKNNFNYFNFRILATLLIDYESEVNKLEEESTREEIIGQTIIKNYLLDYLKEIKEELEIASCDGTLEETYKKILISSHKTTK